MRLKRRIDRKLTDLQGQAEGLGLCPEGTGEPREG